MTPREEIPCGRLIIMIRGVGGQKLPVVVWGLVKRLNKVAERIDVDETFGMAQRGGAVAALINVEFSFNTPSVRRILLGLERIEGARALTELRPGDSAVIANEILLPPGLSVEARLQIPTTEALRSLAASLGVDLTIEDAGAGVPWGVVEAAIKRGLIP
jgi:hypothetical protein